MKPALRGIAWMMLAGALGCARADSPSTKGRSDGRPIAPELVIAHHDFAAHIHRTGASLSSPEGTWALDLHVTRFGREGAMHAVADGEPRQYRDRFEIARGSGAREWFKSDAQGLEQGIDLDERPAGTGELLIEVAVDGLQAVSAGDGVIELRKDGVARLRYAGLVVRDADARIVPSSMRVEDGKIALHMDDREARYPMVVDPIILGQQQAELSASTGASGAQFGIVAINGTTAAVGAPVESTSAASNAGAVYVFTQAGTLWPLQQKIIPSDIHFGDQFGNAIAIDGDTMAIGASGKQVGTTKGQGVVYVYVRSGATWAQQAQLTASDGAGTNYSQFGWSLALSGNTLVASAHAAKVGTADAQGAVYVFGRSGTTWTQSQKLVSSDGVAQDQFGTSVALSGTTLAIGAAYHPYDSVAAASGPGAVYVFSSSAGTWSQTQELSASDGAALDLFGSDVALNGSTMLVGAYNKTVGSNAGQGCAYIFGNTSGSWAQSQQLFSSDGAANDLFGQSVALAGTTAIIGAPGKTIGTDSSEGAAYTFVSGGSGFAQQSQLNATDGAASDAFGGSVALAGSIALIGATGKSVGGSAGQGAAYVFVPAHANGDVCTASTDCNSLSCVDGVCCGSSSCPTCATCNGATPGTCSPKPEGVTPSSACGVYACDGKSQSCPTTCATDVDCLSGNYCTSTHVCTTKLTVGTTCAANTECSTGHCTDGVCCSTASCSSGSACNVSGHAGACTKVGGTTCSGDGECGTGFCVDGVCCDRACAGQCEACDLATSPGKCAPTVGSPHGKRAACDALAATDCGHRQCDGKTVDACAGYVNGTTQSCKAAACSGDDIVESAACDGLGACKVPTPRPCVPFTCRGAVCLTSCSDKADCASGFSCDTATHTCIQGATCSADRSQSIDKSGVATSCGAYLCSTDGTCATSCGDTSNCAPGNNCLDGQCVAPASGAGGASGGGCSAGGRQTSSGETMLGLMFGVLGVLRAAGRRRARRRAGRIEGH